MRFSSWFLAGRATALVISRQSEMGCVEKSRKWGYAGVLFAYSYQIPYPENCDSIGLQLGQEFLGQSRLRIPRDSRTFEGADYLCTVFPGVTYGC